MKVFLDDIRTPQVAFKYTYDQIYLGDGWLIVRNFDEFTKAINTYYELTKDNNLFESKLPDLISFDHDLADIHYDPDTWKEGFKYQEKTGYDCAKWLVNFCIDKKEKLPLFMCHSANPGGKKNILTYLTNFKKFQKNENEENFQRESS
jgi:hypothetical protein